MIRGSIESEKQAANEAAGIVFGENGIGAIGNHRGSKVVREIDSTYNPGMKMNPDVAMLLFISLSPLIMAIVVGFLVAFGGH